MNSASVNTLATDEVTFMTSMDTNRNNDKIINTNNSNVQLLSRVPNEQSDY